MIEDLHNHPWSSSPRCTLYGLYPTDHCCIGLPIALAIIFLDDRSWRSLLVAGGGKSVTCSCMMADVSTTNNARPNDQNQSSFFGITTILEPRKRSNRRFKHSFFILGRLYVQQYPYIDCWKKGCFGTETQYRRVPLSIELSPCVCVYASMLYAPTMEGWNVTFICYGSRILDLIFTYM